MSTGRDLPAADTTRFPMAPGIRGTLLTLYLALVLPLPVLAPMELQPDRKSTRLNSSHRT